jgi:2-amino-4-hydroxy-6-hydroxymethyldihydropteridine diphosphokinase
VHERRIVIGMGSNLGDRRALLERAVEHLQRDPELRVVARSPLYETEPVGGPEQGDYANGAVLVTSALEGHAVLERLLAIELDLGRVRSVRNAPRTVDLDVLWIEGEVLESEALVVPHPRLEERTFALRPLLDVAPDACNASGIPYATLPFASAPLRLLEP